MSINDRDWTPRQLAAFTGLVAFIVALVVAFVTVSVVGSQTNSALRANAINATDGANLLRGVARLLMSDGKPMPADPGSFSDLLRIRDPEATYDTGRIVVCGPEQEVAYLRQLVLHRRVAVRDGCERLEPIP